MQISATATYFRQSNYTSDTGFGIGTLIDNDLIRGDDAGEAVTLGIGIAPGGGPRPFFNQNLEMLANITFTDGTSLTGVQSLFSSNTSYGLGDYFFLFDTDALAAVGKSITDVARVSSFAPTDHSLDWTDFGFSGNPTPPVLPPPPPPPPVLNRIEGTAGQDVLRGTNGDDLIIANGGNRDRLTGRGGEDTFVFGAQTGNGVRDIAVITDYDAFEDTILLTNGAEMARFTESGSTVTIFLTGGDGDRIILQNVPDSGPLFKLEVDADFLV